MPTLFPSKVVQLAAAVAFSASTSPDALHADEPSGAQASTNQISAHVGTTNSVQQDLGHSQFPTVGRDIVMLSHSTDLKKLVHADPLVVVASLPQHKELNLACQAAFEYSLDHLFNTNGEDAAHALLLRADGFGVADYRDAVVRGLSLRDTHIRLLESQTGLDRNHTNRLAFYADPSLRRFVEVYDQLAWVDDSRTSDQRIHDAMQVSRNLHLAEQEGDLWEIQQAYQDLKFTRQNYYPVKAFEGRAVVLAAHAEKLDDKIDSTSSIKQSPDAVQRLIKVSGDVHRFGKKTLRAVLEHEATAGSGNFQFFRPQSLSLIELNEVKENILSAIKRTAPTYRGFTFVFDGHAHTNALALSERDLVRKDPEHGITRTRRAVTISVEEFVAALGARIRNFPLPENVPPERKEIIFIAGCFSQNFIRSVATLLGKQDRFVFLSAAEFGQFSYSDLESPYGAKAFHRALSEVGDRLKLNPAASRTTLGDLVRFGAKDDMRVTLFVPILLGPPVPSKVPRVPYMQIGSRSDEQRLPPNG